MHGKHLLRARSKMQTTIALISGQSEALAAIRAGTGTLGMISLMRDIGSAVTATLWVDASAALDILVTWNGSRIHKITAWGANLSCHCLLHGAGCKAPAVSAGKIPSDKVFVDWLLGAMSHDGVATTSRADHLAQGKALKDQHR